MTLLLKNEADIIESNIDFHLRHGVDHVIATDNGSSDGTLDILATYEKRGILTVIHEPGRDFSQSRWVTRMVHLARDRYGADWVLNNDADEFWYPSKGNLKTELAVSPYNLIGYERHNMLCPHEREKKGDWHLDARYRILDPLPPPTLADTFPDEFPSPHFYWRLPGKVMCRAAGLKRVHQGNHDADFENKNSSTSDATVIYHYPFRCRSQFLRKVIQGGSAYARNKELPPSVGWQWRRWHNKYLENRSEEIFREVMPSKQRLLRDLAEGILVEDKTMTRSL